MKILDPDKLKIGYVILVAGNKFAIQKVQERAGYGKSSKWTHVAGSLGGYDAIEASLPKCRLINVQTAFIDKGYEIKVLRRKHQPEKERFKVALWWATMNNLPYDIMQFCYFPVYLFCAKIGAILHRTFSGKKTILCSELIASGFYKEGDFLFNKPQDQVFPADFDNPELFDEMHNIWK